MTEQERLLEKAKKDYPIGTVFLSAYSNTKHTSNGVFEVLCEYDITVDRMSVYWKGKWAEIISRPEDKPTKDRPFYVVVTEDNKDVLSKWRDVKLVVGKLVGLSLTGTKLEKGHNPVAQSKGDTYTFGNEITFEQFLDLYPEYKESKPQFEGGNGGLWYNSYKNTNEIRKALPHEIPQPSIGKTVKVHVPFKLENGEWDMKAVQDECKKRYPIGCRFRIYSAHTLIKDSVVYSICGNQIYAHQMAGSLFNNGKWAELISLTESSHTMEHYIDQLPPHLKKRVKEIFNSQDIDLGEECDNMFDCINAFCWDDTCEGSDYWDTLNSLLEDDRDISNYGLPKTMSMDDLLEEAKRRYPVGTLYKNFLGQTFISQFDAVESITGEIYVSRDLGSGMVWSNGKWAEIVTESHDHKIIDVSVQPLSMTIPLLQPLLKV